LLRCSVAFADASTFARFLYSRRLVLKERTHGLTRQLLSTQLMRLATSAPTEGRAMRTKASASVRPRSKDGCVEPTHVLCLRGFNVYVFFVCCHVRRVKGCSAAVVFTTLAMAMGAA